MKRLLQAIRLRRMAPGQIKRWTVGRSRIEVGPYSYGYRRMQVLEWNEGASLRIGAYCSIAGDVRFVLGGNHRTDWITTFPFGHMYHDVFGPDAAPGQPATRGDITVGNDVWLGQGCTILSGVTIGDGAVVAMGAMVTRDIGPYEVWGGNPARCVALRFAPDVVDRLLALRWWELPEPVIRRMVPDLSLAPGAEVLDRLEAARQSHDTTGILPR